MANNRRNPGDQRRGRQPRKRAVGAEEVQGTAEPINNPAVPGEERWQQPDKEPQAVAEERTQDTASAGSPPPGEQVPPVTEKPVATWRIAPQKNVTLTKISQYVVSVNDTMGAIVSIEKLDERTGKLREFTPEEYVAAYGFACCTAPYYATYAISWYDPLSNPAVQAYMKGIAN